MNAQLADVVPLLEAVYRVEQPTGDWLQGVLEASRPLLDRGLGVHGFRFEPNDHGHYEPHDPLCLGATDSWMQAWRANWWERWIVPLDDQAIRKAVSFGPCSYATHLWAAMAAEIPTYAEFLSRLAHEGYGHVLTQYADTSATSDQPALFYPDSFNLVAVDSSCVATVLLANLERPQTSAVSVDEYELWGRVAAHIAAGSRLQRALASGHASQPPPPDAVFSPDGKLHHAQGAAQEPEARDLLRNAALRVDRARTRQARRSAESSLSLWRALYDEQWSIFDQFDADGRRFLIVRRNTAKTDPNAKQSAREQQIQTLVTLGHSNKAIAYELGLSVSTVSSHVSHLKRRFGAKTRAELIRAMHTRAGHPS